MFVQLHSLCTFLHSFFLITVENPVGVFSPCTLKVECQLCMHRVAKSIFILLRVPIHA